jgi:hypothetical protein
MTPSRTARALAYWRAHGRDDVAERLEADLAAAGRCRRCGRRLLRAESVAAGVGPECATREPPARLEDR